MRILVAVLLLAVAADAQTPQFEDEIGACTPPTCNGEELDADGPGDSSFANPRPEPPVELLFDPFQQQLTNIYNLVNQQPIYGYLAAGDEVDVYDYNVDADEFDRAMAQDGTTFVDRDIYLTDVLIPGDRAALLSAYTLTPACTNQNMNYFGTAVIAPPNTLYDAETGSLIGATDYDTLPEVLEEALDDANLEGMTVVWTEDRPPLPPLTDADRSFFVVPPPDPTNLRWYLPFGCFVQFPPGRVDCPNAADARAINVYFYNDGVSTPNIDLKIVVFKSSEAGGGSSESESDEGEGGDYTLDVGSVIITFAVNGLERVTNSTHLVNGCEIF